MDYFETSIRCLEAAAPALARRIRDAREEAGLRYRIEKARSGDLTMLVTDTEGHERLMHSRHDPRREAQRIVESSVDPEADCVIVGGFGLAWHIEAILRQAPSASIVVAEDEPAVLAAACSARDLGPILGGGRIDLALGERTDDIVTLLEGKPSRKVSLFLHRASADRNPGFYHNLKNILYSWLNGKEVNLATLIRFERLWTRNLLRNLPLFARTPGVSSLFGTLEHVPVFVVAAGPSLAKNIHLLHEARNKGIIIAVDTIYKVLLAHGITPDIVVAVDPQLINAHFIAGASSRTTILVADSAVSPTLLANHQGPRILSAVPFPFAAWFESLFGQRGALSSGGSVATSAFDLAVRMGGNPVILLGQDLAYGESRIHMRGTSGEERWENTCTRTTPVTKNMRAFLRENCTVRVRSWDTGSEVWSDRKFLTFLWWFERQIKMLEGTTRIINATEGGAHITGAEHKTLRSVLDELPERETRVSLPLPMDPMLPMDRGQALLPMDRGQAGSAVSLKPCLEAAREFSRFLEDLIRKTTRAEELCQTVIEGHAQASVVLPELDETDVWIHAHPVWSRLISSSLQRVIHTVKEGFSLTGESREAGIHGTFRESAVLYHGIGDAAATMLRQIRFCILERFPSAD